jgi:hypothetical protein
MGSTLYTKRQYHRKKKPRPGRGREKRPKTFATEAKAKAYAAAQKIEKYEITMLHEGKFRVDPL